MWLNKKHLEEELDHKKFWMTTRKDLLNHRKHKYKLAEEPKTTQQHYYRQRISNQSNPRLWNNSSK